MVLFGDKEDMHMIYATAGHGGLRLNASWHAGWTSI